MHDEELQLDETLVLRSNEGLTRCKLWVADGAYILVSGEHVLICDCVVRVSTKRSSPVVRAAPNCGEVRIDGCSFVVEDWETCPDCGARAAPGRHWDERCPSGLLAGVMNT